MTVPTQRPASHSEGRKRAQEKAASVAAPAEPDADERMRERAEAFLVQCGPCDAGLPMGCACPDADPRPVIADLLDALASRTPDAHLAAAKAEALEEAAEAIEGDPGIRLGHNVSVVCSCLRCEVAQSCARLVRARAARLREQGGE